MREQNNRYQSSVRAGGQRVTRKQDAMVEILRVAKNTSLRADQLLADSRGALAIQTKKSRKKRKRPRKRRKASQEKRRRGS